MDVVEFVTARLESTHCKDRLVLIASIISIKQINIFIYVYMKQEIANVIQWIQRDRWNSTQPN